MVEESLVNRVNGYLYASPRYHSVQTITTQYLPDNYFDYDSVNQTYDKYFPCYILTSSDEPKLEMVDPANEVSIVNGDIRLFQLSEKQKGKELGRKLDRTTFVNSNLESKVVFYRENLHTKLSPGWSHIQIMGTASSPIYLIRSLGNNDSIKVHSAVELPSNATVSVSPFPKGFIAIYKKKIWRCELETNEFPISGEYWREINHSDNVFHIDLYTINTTNSVFLMEISDPIRRFNPDIEDTLVTWNVSYYH